MFGIINYYKPIVDGKGYVHSIDMVYIEYFSYAKPEVIIDLVRKLHEKYPALNYNEHLGRQPHSRFDYYLDGVALGGAYVHAGKYTNYDKVSKTFDILPMFELRVNPNKYFHEAWFQELLSVLLSNASSGMLRKYDYAVDIPTEPKHVKVLESKKEPGLYKGTRYYGQDGRHGYLKVYDKQKDMQRQKVDIPPLTRVEHTLFAKKEISLEKVYVLENACLKGDYSDLNDTERCIVEMYLELKALGSTYEPKLGRKMTHKLKEYISGQYALLDYGNILDLLLENIRVVFRATDILTDDEGFMQVSDEDIPFFE